MSKYNNDMQKKNSSGWQLVTLFFLNIINMIRRLISTFIEWNPSNLSHSDFFQQNQIIPNVFADKKLEHLNWLHDSAPAFPVKANNIQVISEPQQFYDTVLEKSANAKKRIVLASLYLGIGKLETDLVKSIQQNLKENVSLEVNILLDYTRGTRGIVNSKTMLMPLIQESDNCNLSLYHTPALRGITKKLAPSRWNELLGLQHMKLYLFDDTVIMSGANLSNDYFSNRQDRYIVVEDRRLANFFTNFIAKVQEFSMKVDRDGEVNLHDSWKLSPYQSPHMDFALEAKKRIQSFFHTIYEQQKSLTDEIATADTWVFPTMEMGQLKIHHDSIVTKRLLATSPKGSTLKMATGYFNLTGSYMDSIVKECEADCSIIMAHPNANGFTGAKGPAGAIPAAYSLLAKRFYEKIKKSGQEDRISLLEYERPNWSYHAKGIWYYPHNSKLPYMTVIGSSNYGERSVNRDLESQICLVTTNKRLQNDLQTEYDHLYNFASTAESQLIARYVPQWVKIVVGLFKNFF